METKSKISTRTLSYRWPGENTPMGTIRIAKWLMKMTALSWRKSGLDILFIYFHPLFVGNYQLNILPNTYASYLL